MSLDQNLSDHEQIEADIEDRIKDCGNRMVAASAAGDREDVNLWRDRMHTAIKSRTPQHQARMTARIDSTIWVQGEEALALGKAAP